MMSLRTQIVTRIPPSIRISLRWARELLMLAKCSIYDLRRYLRHSASVNPYRTQRSLQALIQKRQHIVEKGLALPAPRPGFGAENITLLARDVSAYLDRFGSDSLIDSCVGALNAYQAFNRSAGIESPLPSKILEKLEIQIKETKRQNESQLIGGVDLVKSIDLKEASRGPFEELARSRRSIRNFKTDVVPIQEIEAAARIAQFTPSVCNRQAWRLHCYQKEDCRPLLAIQTGNRGFDETVQNLLVVTCHLSAFMGAGERNQAYSDGGMFAMSLVYALHSKGIGTCCLNLCLGPEEDRAFHKAGGISNEEVLIMAIAIGYLPDVLSVAQSNRRPLEKLLIFHSSKLSSAPSFETGQK